LIGRNPVNLIVSWCGQFLFFVVLCQFSQVVGEWLENQILIPDWTYFHCPGITLAGNFDNLIKNLAKVIAMDANAGFCTYDLLASSCKHV